MPRAVVEIDFFAMENARSYSAVDHQSASGSGIDLSAFSAIDPLLSQRVISPQAAFAQMPLTLPQADRFFSPWSMPIPSVDPSCRPAMKTESKSVTVPLTIFYNGKVSVFDLPQHKVEAIIKFATESSSSDVDYSAGLGLLAKFNHGLLPLARKKSLQRFLEKRKQRIMAAVPYKSEQEAGPVKKTTTPDAF